MYLQGDNKQFGKFVGYGCWCLSGADMDLGEPSGEPVDAIDRACRQDWYTYSRDPPLVVLTIAPMTHLGLKLGTNPYKVSQLPAVP